MTSSFTNDSIPNDEIPVLLTIFNRPDKTKAVIDNLRTIKPKRLFVAADGPRRDNSQDREKCQLARQVIECIDWECEIKKKYLEDNFGCDKAVPMAIDWFFHNVNHGVILEDDCIISSQFFSFCGDLLLRYADDERIMQISSIAPYIERAHVYDYHFSRIFRCSGGWATWRRAWANYASMIKGFSEIEAFEILKASNRDYYQCLWQYKRYLAYKKGVLNVYKKGALIKQYWGHWDYQWNLVCASQNGLCIVPEKNMMINIGFDHESTNTKNKNIVFENLKCMKITYPLRHPQFVYDDYEPERLLEIRIYKNLPIKSRFMYLFRRMLGAIYYLREILSHRSIYMTK